VTVGGKASMGAVGALAVLVLLATGVRASVRSQALYARGLIPFNNGQWDEAYGLFDQAVQADQTDALALYYRGLTQARRGAAAAAIQDMEQALKLNPQLPHAALDLGIAYFNTGQYPNARTALERAYGQGTERFTAAYFLGLTLYRMGDDAGAQKYLTEAKADPELRPSAEYYSGLALLRQGQTEAGRTALVQAAQEQPQSEIGRAAQRYTAAEVRQPPAAVETVRKKPWSLYGDLAFQYDTNVLIAPSDSDLKTAEGISHQSDGRFVIGAGGDYVLGEGPAGSLRAEYDFSQSVHFRLTNFDLQSHRVRIDAASRPDTVRYGLAVTYDFYLLDYKSFFQEPLLTPWLAVAEGEGAVTQAYYTFRYRDFFRSPFDPERDGINHAAGIRQYATVGRSDVVLGAGYQFDFEDTLNKDDDTQTGTPPTTTVGAGARDFQYVGNQVDVDVSFPVLTLAQGEVGYLFRLENYEFPNSRSGCSGVPGQSCPSGPFHFRRHDNEHQFVVSLSRDLTPHLALGVDYLGVLNNSNLADFDYNRNIISVGVRRTF
jgi:tetratricopeptide (TPR) repeat protein